jgi:hypothetical protein
VIHHASGVKIIKRFRLALLALAAVAAGSGMFAAAMVAAQTPATHPAESPSKLAMSNSAAASAGPSEMVTGLSRRPTEAQPNEHPLMPVLRWAQRGLPAIESLKDYSATLVRRERIHGQLSNYEYAAIKIRHQPFSVYVNFLAPASVKGQEVVYIAGENEGKLLAHKARMAVTFPLDPEGLIAMSGRRYPLTEIGLVNLVRRLVEVGQQDVNYDECEVKYFTRAKVGERVCTVIEVVHPTPRDHFRFHLARVFVDDELMVPIRYESHDWPRESGGKPELIEEYTYLDLKLNNGFTDADFNARNPVYHFHPAASEPDRREESQ